MKTNTMNALTPPKISSMEEMKRWQGEREDRLHKEHVKTLMLSRANDKKRATKPK